MASTMYIIVFIACMPEYYCYGAFSDSKTVSRFSSVKMKSTTKIKNASATFTFIEIIKDLNTLPFDRIARDTKYHNAGKKNFFCCLCSIFLLKKACL